MVYSIHYRDEGASLSFSDVNHYTIMEIYHILFSMCLRYSYASENLKYTRPFFHKVAYTRHEV
jgi:hypothetical protein